LPTTEKCVILVPVGQSIAPACERGLRQLEARGYPVWRVYGFAAIDVARSWIATQALQQGFEELMWIDADIGFEFPDVERLRAHNLDLAAAVYPKKGKHALACHVLPGTERLVLGQQGGLMEVLYTAAGFLYTRRRLYEDIRQVCRLPVCNERLGDPLIPFFQPLVVEEDGACRYLGEDFAFCHRARQAGRKILVDLSIRLWHIGQYAYGWEDAGSPLTRYETYDFRLSPPKPPGSQG
jgi:hypothetical protein